MTLEEIKTAILNGLEKNKVTTYQLQKAGVGSTTLKTFKENGTNTAIATVLTLARLGGIEITAEEIKTLKP